MIQDFSVNSKSSFSQKLWIVSKINHYLNHDLLHIVTHYLCQQGKYLEYLVFTTLNSGVYFCLASNGVPPTVSKKVRLYVDCKNQIPVLISSPALHRGRFLGIFVERSLELWKNVKIH